MTCDVIWDSDEIIDGNLCIIGDTKLTVHNRGLKANGNIYVYGFISIHGDITANGLYAGKVINYVPQSSYNYGVIFKPKAYINILEIRDIGE